MLPKAINTVIFAELSAYLKELVSVNNCGVQTNKGTSINSWLSMTTTLGGKSKLFLEKLKLFLEKLTLLRCYSGRGLGYDIKVLGTVF